MPIRKPASHSLASRAMLLVLSEIEGELFGFKVNLGYFPIPDVHALRTFFIETEEKFESIFL